MAKKRKQSGAQHAAGPDAPWSDLRTMAYFDHLRLHGVFYRAVGAAPPDGYPRKRKPAVEIGATAGGILFDDDEATRGELEDVIAAADKLFELGFASGDGGRQGMILSLAIALELLARLPTGIVDTDPVVRHLSRLEAALYDLDFGDVQPCLRHSPRKAKRARDGRAKRMFKVLCVCAAEASERTGTRSRKAANDRIAKHASEAYRRVFGDRVGRYSFSGTMIEGWRDKFSSTVYASPAAVHPEERRVLELARRRIDGGECLKVEKWALGQLASEKWPAPPADDEAEADE